MIERIILKHLVARLCIGLSAIPLCIAVTSNSPAQERIDHAVSATAPPAEAFAPFPALLAARYPTIRSLVLARHDCVEFEYYRTGLSAQSQSPMHSIAKSVLSILVGIARDQGYLRLDKKLSELLPEVLDPVVDLSVRDITIRDLLTTTSGFGLAPVGMRRGVPPPEGWQWSLRRPMLDTPGYQFRYDDDSANLLSVGLTRAIRQSSRTSAEDNLFRPLQLTDVDWTVDNDGYLIGATGLSLTARDMAKLGLLYLQRGRWDDQQIVSSTMSPTPLRSTMTEAFRPEPPMAFFGGSRRPRPGWTPSSPPERAVSLSTLCLGLALL